jgi:hypothetical protein
MIMKYLHFYAFLLIIIILIAGCVSTGDQEKDSITEFWMNPEITILSDNDDETQSFFGQFIDIDDDYAIVGLPFKDRNIPGTAWIYKREGSTWIKEQELIHENNSKTIATFQVALSGDTSIMSAKGKNSFRMCDASVFVREDSLWTHQGILEPDDYRNTSLFGSSFDIDGDHVVISGSRNENKGNVYIFHRQEKTWTLIQSIVRNSPEKYFGLVTKIYGRIVLVYSHTIGESGNVCVYRITGDGLKREQTVKARDASPDDGFGTCFDLSGNYLIIGAAGKNEKGKNSGAAYIFHRNGTEWKEIQKLIPPDGSEEDYFGGSVGISGNYCFVGARGDDDKKKNSGSVYIFYNNGTTWSFINKITAPHPMKEEYFGARLRASGNSVIIGTQRNSSIGEKAYIMTEPSLPVSEPTSIPTIKATPSPTPVPTSVPTNLPTKEPTPAPPIVTEFYASSYIDFEDMYIPSVVFDDDPRTGWLESEEGPGIGEFIGLEFAEPITIDEIKILPGYGDEKWWAANNRVKKMEIKLDDYSVTATFIDKLITQRIKLDQPVQFKIGIFVIRDVYLSHKDNDAGISEIQFFYQGKKIDFMTREEKNKENSENSEEDISIQPVQENNQRIFVEGQIFSHVWSPDGRGYKNTT